MHRRLRSALTLVVVLAATAAAHAQFYNVAIYSGGEFDASPTNGGSVTASANNGWVPWGAMHGLFPRGGTTAATWSNATSPGSGSTFAYNFDGNSGYVSGGMISSDYYNVGMELWVKLSFVDGNLQTLMHNGPASRRVSASAFLMANGPVSSGDICGWMAGSTASLPPPTPGLNWLS